MLIEFHRKMLADHVRSAAFEAALRQVIRPGETTVADIGAGTGVLGFIAARLGAREVHLIEHGDVIELAAHMADANRIPGLQFWRAHSGDIADPPKVDVVVAEILGNLALEENAVETLVDAQRFLKPGGTLIPARIEQWVAPIVTDTLWSELTSWRATPLGLDFGAAEAMSFDNVYVRTIAAADLLPGDSARRWDALEFNDEITGLRRGEVRWSTESRTTVHGLALWWRAELVPGVWLETSPTAPPTHWEQVFAPLQEPIAAEAGDQLVLTIESETGGGEAGIGLRWVVRQERDGAVLVLRQHDIGRGYLG
jgi:Ribosomal protein L11 methyltransferase (PrmA)